MGNIPLIYVFAFGWVASGLSLAYWMLHYAKFIEESVPTRIVSRTDQVLAASGTDVTSPGFTATHGIGRTLSRMFIG